MRERMRAYLTDGVDVDVVLGLLRVGNKWLDEEVPQHALDVLDLDGLVGALGDPGLGVGPGGIELEQAGLASPLDELVGLCDKLGAGGEQEGIGGLGAVEDTVDVVALLEAEDGEFGGRVVGGLGRQRGGLEKGRAGEVVVENGLAVGLEDGLGGHGGGCIGCSTGVRWRIGGR